MANRLRNVADYVDAAAVHEDRVEALQKREELQAKKEALEQERADIRFVNRSGALIEFELGHAPLVTGRVK